MAYKDPDKQREADKARQQRRRDVIKAKGVTNTGCDGQGVTDKALPQFKDLPSSASLGTHSAFSKLSKDIVIGKQGHQVLRGFAS
ncbi:hypothetical protein LCGC14_1891470 [marine sediment metagenome]|uniref:Uncharacterized protein n=1 Tax=marine sediment metagenome TaxID=412755 RepID=A0A0F9IXJ3_9ZZZZ